MGSSQQLVAGLALLAIVVSVSARPEPAELNPLPPADLPKEPVKLTEPAKPTEKPAQLTEKPAQLTEKPVPLTEDGAKVIQEAPKGDKLAEDAFLASLPQALPGKEAVQVPVVIADLPEPEAVVVVPNGPRGRLLTRMARAHLPAEARGADGDGLEVPEATDVIGEGPGDLQRTSSEGFTPYIEPSSAGAVREPVISESLGGRPIYIPVIDGHSSTELIIDEDASRKEKLPTSAPSPTAPTTPSPKMREAMIARAKDQIRAEINGASAARPLIDIAAPVQDVTVGLADDRQRIVDEALKPYQALLARVQEASAVDLVVGDVQGRAEATRLVLRPMAKAVAGRGGIAVAAPLSRAVVRGEQPVRVRYEPNIVAVAGPSGMAHALGELLLQYADRPQI